VTSSTFSGNSASGYGGGIYNSGGTLAVSSSTFSSNSASGFGGTLITFSNGALTASNSLFSGN